MASVADSAVNYDFAGHWFQAGYDLFCQDGDVSACRCFAFCRQMSLKVGVSLYVVLLVLLLITFWMSAAVSWSAWRPWRLIVIVGGFERIHIKGFLAFSFSGQDKDYDRSDNHYYQNFLWANQ